MLSGTLLYFLLAVNVVCSKVKCFIVYTDGQDFSAVNDTLEFGVDAIQMEVMIFIMDNSALEDVEQFTVEIEPVPGVFPVVVIGNIYSNHYNNRQ
jgi:hypothetical protein